MSAMDCKECQGLFSDFLERGLDPVRHENVTIHLASCEACKSSYKGFQGIVRSMRSAPREEVPVGLKEAVLASLPVPRAMSPVPVRAPRRRSEAPRWAALQSAAPRLTASRLTASRLAAAAAILVACVLAIRGSGRDASWQSRLADAVMRERASQASLESVASAQRLDLEQRLGRLEQSLASESAQRKSAEDSNHVEEEKRRELEAALSRLEAEARSKGERLERLEKDLALARAEQKASAELMRAAEKALAEARRLESRGADSLVAGAPEPRGEASEPPRRRNTILRESGGRLELSVRGPREQVVPELFAMARNAAHSDAAELALNALENLIPSSPIEPPAPARSESWIRSRFDDVAGALGMAQAELDSAAVPPSAASRRSARIAALEQAWNEERNTQQK